MDCQECGKRPATLHFTQVINGEKSEIHVCEVCAKEKGYMSDSEDSFSLQNLISGLFHYKKNQLNTGTSNLVEDSSTDLQCPDCKLTFSRFQRMSKFGCSTCYDTFGGRLNSIFRRVHSGNTKHYGKIPKRAGGHIHVKKQIKDLQIYLEQLIEEEAFEEAAKIRDEIRTLRDQVDQNGTQEDEAKESDEE